MGGQPSVSRRLLLLMAGKPNREIRSVQHVVARIPIHKKKKKKTKIHNNKWKEGYRATCGVLFGSRPMCVCVCVVVVGRRGARGVKKRGKQSKGKGK